ncbi:hypothetical protein [Longimicrobium sp.]|uniref:hypothetical protein n=1 Tax=Longimicrobium sp. TaxID=2029185 RepID=UPI002BCCFC7F|nr:hypothetical protein [Longimicrobium sp.]HSU15842.1 hypothetical protein [Longimicrobium sp.]
MSTVRIEAPGEEARREEWDGLDGAAVDAFLGAARREAGSFAAAGSGDRVVGYSATGDADGVVVFVSERNGQIASLSPGAELLLENARHEKWARERRSAADPAGSEAHPETESA